jgi:hypothetical protein
MIVMLTNGGHTSLRRRKRVSFCLALPLLLLLRLKVQSWVACTAGVVAAAWVDVVLIQCLPP